ncbi:hypothetical protein [Mesorhizobium sp. WSM4311]|uniref:hypothetical protein n=1 Tax=Mesorhizobium sp. WSM4311 TaxID=2029410 RepID=UPI000BAFCC7F|nr:hypothetical protein [Mesorhizobium sp. WSM4311]
MITLCDYMLPILRKSLLCAAHNKAAAQHDGTAALQYTSSASYMPQLHAENLVFDPVRHNDFITLSEEQALGDIYAT